jgi:hypothetical protein
MTTLLVSILAVHGFTATQSPVPAHLTIVAASINELPPITWRNVGDRKVRLRVQLAGRPPCTAGRTLAYGFLIDADLNPQSGLAGGEHADLGVDARVTMQCDPASGRFRSPLGTVTQSVVGGRTTIDLVTTVRSLPAVDFQWIAYAAEGDAWTRMPEAPGHGSWAIRERTIF